MEAASTAVADVVSTLRDRVRAKEEELEELRRLADVEEAHLDSSSLHPLPTCSRPSSAPLVGSGSLRNLIQAGFAMQCEDNAEGEQQVVADGHTEADSGPDPASPQRWRGLMRALSKGGLFEMRAEREAEAAHGAAGEMEVTAEVTASESEAKADAEVADSALAALATSSSRSAQATRPSVSFHRMFDCTQGDILSADRELALWQLLERCELTPLENADEQQQEFEEDEDDDD